MLISYASLKCPNGRPRDCFWDLMLLDYSRYHMGELGDVSHWLYRVRYGMLWAQGAAKVVNP